MCISAVPSPPPCAIPFNALAGPVHPQFPSADWNGLAVIGEAPGREESIIGKPFAGSAGELLDELLSKAGIDRAASFVMNPFMYQPVWTPLDNNTRRNNDILNFFTKDVTKANTMIHSGATYRSQYVRSTNADDLRYAWKTLHYLKPKAILAMGATALWFATGHDRIGEFRGKPQSTPIVPNVPVVPTFHPAFALYRNREQSILDTIVEDIELAKNYL
ncbi:MAG: hypothetical protein DI537_05450 [Stutzerimonas stutzeri]|nr:MAG: hypothetical protein DI537_05450 [Stutzerimonas stutzeri]